MYARERMSRAGTSIPRYSRPVVLLATLLSVTGLMAQQRHPKAVETIQNAIEAMGGTRYLEVKNSHSSGNYFIFNKGRQGFTRFQDWTEYDPVKSRFQLGEGKKQQVDIHNLALRKGWTLEGENEVSDMPEEQIQRFAKSIQRNLNVLLRNRLEEEGMGLYYYAPDEVAGSGEFEAVEFLDATNNSVVVFFDLTSHLPTKLETQVPNQLGIRRKRETEFSTWHDIQGVLTPLRTDYLTEGERTAQIFIREISYNVAIPQTFFLEPTPKE